MHIINGKKDGFVGEDIIYIGRKNAYYNLKASPLNNPYAVRHNRTLAESLQLYKAWILQMYSLKKGSVYDELIRLAQLEKKGVDFKLACWCKPNDCHGDIIKQIILVLLKHNIV